MQRGLGGARTGWMAWNWAGISSHTFNEHSKLMNM